MFNQKTNNTCSIHPNEGQHWNKKTPNSLEFGVKNAFNGSSCGIGGNLTIF